SRPMMRRMRTPRKTNRTRRKLPPQRSRNPSTNSPRARHEPRKPTDRTMRPRGLTVRTAAGRPRVRRQGTRDTLGGMSNQLADATSPYLLQHAENPVDWRQWDESALAEARARDVPILLSIGYAACHWCHVMAHESFDDAETAEMMNTNFVNIKVDREERPDIDAVYMTATQAMTGQGGWPMTCFLTP